MKKVRIIMYNNVGTYPEAAMEDAVSADAFARDMSFLANNGYEVVPLAKALELAESGKPIPDKLLSLSIDGGFTDAYEHVFPILKKHGFPATFLISLPDVGKSLTVYGEQIPCMGWEEIREIAEAGFDIGAYLLSGRFYHHNREEELITAIRDSATAFPDFLNEHLRYVSVREGIPGKAVMETLKEVGIEAFLTKCPTKRRPHRYIIGRIQIDDDDPNIFNIKISRNYLRFKDSRTWRYLRKYKVDRLAHLISDAVNERRVRKSTN
jgi:peptidoglycan/xylan/chitin deacetylase (PgdA/CDA1 family)